MAHCILRLIPRAACIRNTLSVSFSTRSPAFANFSRAFSGNSPAFTATALMHGVDMSSTVVELREFALLHGVSLKGLRLKSDILAAIQMHFGVFARVDPGAHAAGLKLQQENALAAPLVVDEGPLLKPYFFDHQALDGIIARSSHPVFALVALRRMLASTKVDDAVAFPETSSLPNCVMVVAGSSRQMQVIASRAKKAIAAEAAATGSAADVGSDGRHSELWACVVCPNLVLHVFSPEGAKIYMDELIRVRDVSMGRWSPHNFDTRSK